MKVFFLEEMESKLLNISNERKVQTSDHIVFNSLQYGMYIELFSVICLKTLDSSVSKFKRENKELKQQLESLRKSSETLKVA